MRKKTRNRLFEVLRRVETDPRIFDVSETLVDSWECFTLSLASGAHYFVLKERFYGGTWQFAGRYTSFIVDYPEPRFVENLSGVTVNVDQIISIFEAWIPHIRKYFSYLEELAEERDTPDLWAELSSGKPTDTVILPNTLFTLVEQTKIEDTLNQFEKEIETRGILTEQQTKLLHEQVEYLVESSKRLGRKDWLAAAAGSLIGFTLQAGLTSEVATQVLHLAGEALRWIAHTPLLLPG